MKDLRALTNAHQDVRLVSLRAWKGADAIARRDEAGPYVIGQEGYDPDDPTLTPGEFLLGKSGAWIRVSDFFRLPAEERRKEFVFGAAAEVIQMMMSLPARPRVLRAVSTAAAAEEDEDLRATMGEIGRGTPLEGV
ncbi:MAG: hypothetical protein HUU04_03430 [Verrucomicrobiae bacterium]|nr:hypothetical protein [Verrucomicrobiae bacterium]